MQPSPFTNRVRLSVEQPAAWRCGARKGARPAYRRALLSLLWLSTPKCPFIPKYHCWPFLVWRISGSRVPGAFFVDDGAAIIVASTMVPVLTVRPWARKCCPTVSNKLARAHAARADDGTCRPCSRPAPARSERLNQCWRKYPQHALQADGRPAVARLGVHGGNARAEVAPWHHAIHLREEPRPSSRLCVLFEAGPGQRPLRTSHRHLSS